MNKVDQPPGEYGRFGAPSARRRPDARRGAPQRVRMSPDERIEMILAGAVAFFAARGFKAQTRELAREIGVSQSLIYHYFRTKEDLVDRVYERAFMSRWRGEWETILKDRTQPLAKRLKRFYASYLDVIDDQDWIRLVMFSGLDGSNLARRFIESQINGLLKMIAGELAAESGAVGEPDELAVELVWQLHSTFIYYLVRKHIHNTRTIADRGRLIEACVDSFIAGSMASPARQRTAAYAVRI